MMLVGASAANMTNLLSGWVVCSMVGQWAVNPPPSGTLSSILRRPTMKPKQELELLKYWDKLVLKIYGRIEELNEVSDA